MYDAEEWGAMRPENNLAKIVMKSIFEFRWFVMLVQTINDNELYSVISEMPKRRSRNLVRILAKNHVSNALRIHASAVCTIWNVI